MNNAVAVMRVSSDRQGFEGDSIEHQKDQIDQYASNRQIEIKKYFVFIESASKEQQPVQEAINYCKNKKNDIQYFIIKSIDRFTRGGSSLYDQMKTQLNKHDVKLIDVYGIINNQSINTLEHLGVKYPWSVYFPSTKSELLEAERGKDEKRDIMSRMIGAEIRYVRLGYVVRQATFGYENKKVETIHGKRVILIPHPTESVFIKKIYLLKEKGLLSDQKIIEQINLMGFRTRRRYRRDSKDKNKIIGILSDNPLTLKQYDRLLKNPIYAGFNVGKWTNYEPIKCQFDGLVSIETFNKANAGKLMIVEEKGKYKLKKGKILAKRLVATKISIAYPYGKIVLCPNGRHPFYGSAARGKLGKHYPAYHCDNKKRGHYIRIPLKKMHDTVINFLNSVRIKEKHIDRVQAIFDQDQEIIINNSLGQVSSIKDRILQIDMETTLTIQKIKFLHSDITLLALEEEVEKLKKEKEKLILEQAEIQQQIDHEKIENSLSFQQKFNKIPERIIYDHNIDTKTPLFNLLFLELPIYDELVNKTAKLKPEFELVES